MCLSATSETRENLSLFKSHKPVVKRGFNQLYIKKKKKASASIKRTQLGSALLHGQSLTARPTKWWTIVLTLFSCFWAWSTNKQILRPVQTKHRPMHKPQLLQLRTYHSNNNPVTLLKGKQSCIFLNANISVTSHFQNTSDLTQLYMITNSSDIYPNTSDSI